MRITTSIVLFAIFIGTALMAETVQLVAPDFSDENIIGYNVGLRPYRSSGVRIEHERYQGKSIIHNYGHGGAGISLSWGSAIEATKLMEATDAPNLGSTIAVLGSGIMGLTVANQLLDKGYRVRIYAKDFPPRTTSEVAAGLWSPFGVAAGETEEAKERFERIKASSYSYFDALATAASPRFGGVSLFDGYFFSREHEEGASEVEFDSGLRMTARKERSIKVVTPIYMQELQAEAKRRGAEFISRVFGGRDDLLKLDEDIIFNCMGLGSRDVFGDTDLKPVRGQLVYFKPQEGVDYMALLDGPANSSTFFFMLPYKDKLILGGSYEVGQKHCQVDKELCNKIVEQAREFFAPKSHLPDEL